MNPNLVVNFQRKASSETTPVYHVATMWPCIMGPHLGDWQKAAVQSLKLRYLKAWQRDQSSKLHLPHVLLPLGKQDLVMRNQGPKRR